MKHIKAASKAVWNFIGIRVAAVLLGVLFILTALIFPERAYKALQESLHGW